ncbi:M24 family metallopeptidase [Salinimonas chungwhensis]|uniref:M24 family metallopeptidase n=1 Tax=Salinimonas chungwhensis TaxID=265425 RepID=UPI00035DEFE1|nr:M24 family metallopeptidase [Salinimonas chungwhensis]
MKLNARCLTLSLSALWLLATNVNSETTSDERHVGSFSVFQLNSADDDIMFSNESPWPQIRKERVARLLPAAMDKTNLQHWLIICRENNNDPLAPHVGCENAGGTAVVLFSRTSNGVSTRIFSPVSESTALKELNIFDTVVDVNKDKSAIDVAADWLVSHQTAPVAVNSFSDNPQADGLSHSQYLALSTALKDSDIKLVSAEPLVYHWLARKLPEEVAIMAKAATLTSKWEHLAFQQVVPGVTTDKDIATFLKQKIEEAGVQDGWSPDQNPAVNSGPDRGHSHPTDRVIQAGDVIQIDFGIKVFNRWVTDIQRFAYVLHEGETTAPEDIQHAWDSAIKGSRAAFETMRPGISGRDVHSAQQKVMQDAGSLPVMWSTGHPVGYVAHDTGPNLGIRSTSDRKLDVGMTFAFDGFFSWPYSDKDTHKTKTISVEEMVVITSEGATFLTSPQQSLILISGKNR